MQNRGMIWSSSSLSSMMTEQINRQIEKRMWAMIHINFKMNLGVFSLYVISAIKDMIISRAEKTIVRKSSVSTFEWVLVSRKPVPHSRITPRTKMAKQKILIMILSLGFIYWRYPLWRLAELYCELFDLWSSLRVLTL